MQELAAKEVESLTPVFMQTGHARHAGSRGMSSKDWHIVSQDSCSLQVKGVFLQMLTVETPIAGPFSFTKGGAGADRMCSFRSLASTPCTCSRTSGKTAGSEAPGRKARDLVHVFVHPCQSTYPWLSQARYGHAMYVAVFGGAECILTAGVICKREGMQARQYVTQVKLETSL